MCEQSENINELVTALAKFQAEVENPTKNTKGQSGHQTYKYATLGAILEMVRPILSKNGLSVVQLLSTPEAGVQITTQICHSSGQWMRSALTMPIDDSVGKGVVKGTGSACTYGRRYSICALLGIEGDFDDDGAAATGDKVSVEPKPGEISQRVDFTTRPAPTNPYVPEEQVQEFREWMLRKLSTKESRQAAATILRSNGVDFNRSMSVTPAALERVRRELVALIENAEQGDQP